MKQYLSPLFAALLLACMCTATACGTGSGTSTSKSTSSSSTTSASTQATSESTTQSSSGSSRETSAATDRMPEMTLPDIDPDMTDVAPNVPDTGLAGGEGLPEIIDPDTPISDPALPTK